MMLMGVLLWQIKQLSQMSCMLTRDALNARHRRTSTTRPLSLSLSLSLSVNNRFESINAFESIEWRQQWRPAEHAENLRQLGKTFFAKSKFGAAIDAYIEAITLCPKVVVYRTNRVLYFRKQDDWTKVEEDCRKALELDSSSFKSWYQEVSKLKSKYESLQRSQRHLLGEDLEPLSVKELQRLERQLEAALSQARQRRERQLGEMNKHLKSKLEAGQGPFTTIQGTWNAGAIVGNNTFSVHPSQSTTMDCEPTLRNQPPWTVNPPRCRSGITTFLC